MEKLYQLINTNKWVKLFSGLLICAVGLMYVYTLDREEKVDAKGFIFFLSIPGAFSLMGLLEIITGTSFKEMTLKWNSLLSWQRGMLGIIVVIVSLVVSMYGIMFFGKL